MAVIIATWRFGSLACEAGWIVLAAGGSALDAVEAGANAVEEDPSVSSVGYGGLPNADGVVELDAAIMDGMTHAAGSVAAMTGVRKPISVARRVMERTPHSMLAGYNARRFALQEEFQDADLLTEESRRRYDEWCLAQTAPEVAHFRDQHRGGANTIAATTGHHSHDTVGVCALDVAGNLAAACTTSGLAWKRPGRVGDSPIIGSGLYVDNEIGACAATGNGDEIMKVCLSYRVVMLMEQGRGAQEACEEALRYLLRKRAAHVRSGASCVAIARDGQIGAAATRIGFGAPDRLWIYAVNRGEGTVLAEGAYEGEA